MISVLFSNQKIIISRTKLILILSLFFRWQQKWSKTRHESSNFHSWTLGHLNFITNKCDISEKWNKHISDFKKLLPKRRIQQNVTLLVNRWGISRPDVLNAEPWCFLFFWFYYFFLIMVSSTPQPFFLSCASRKPN